MEGSGGGKRPWEQFPGRLMLSALLGVRVEVTSDVYLGDVDGKSSGLKKNHESDVFKPRIIPS